MSAMTHIRKSVLDMSQAALAELTGVTQATVSRWEKGELSPDLNALSRIREEAQRRGKEWDDRWFFEVPVQAEPEAA